MFAPKVAKAQTKTGASSTNKRALQRGASRLSHDAVGLPLFLQRTTARSSLPSVIQQPKLAVGEVNDPLERQADQVADQVMCMSDPRVEATPAPFQVSRACAACEPDETLRKKSASRSEANDAPQAVHDTLNEPGEPLDAATREFFEPRYLHDFSAVRVHTDATAAASARAVNALAYTVGRHIVFGAGQYAPSTPAGLKLTAHELTHVVQQAGGARAVQRQAAPPPPVVDTGLANFQRMIQIMRNDTTMRTAFEMIARDGVYIMLFETGFDRWQYDDGHVEEEELPGLLGNTDVKGQTIRLRDSQSPDTMAETLFHELQHWAHNRNPAGPRGLESEIQARIATEQSAIDRGRPPTDTNYRTADGRVNEAEIRRSMAASPHYSPIGRKRIGRRYVGETSVLGPSQIGDYPTPSRERAVT